MQSSKASYVKSISILHLALLIGQFLFGIIILLLVHSIGDRTSRLKGIDQPLLILCLFLGVAACLGGTFLFRKKLDQINQDGKEIHKKLTDYRSASITRWAILESSILFSIIIFFITGKYLIISISLILIIFFASLRPTEKKITSDLNISEQEIDNLNQIGA